MKGILLKGAISGDTHCGILSGDLMAVSVALRPTRFTLKHRAVDYAKYRKAGLKCATSTETDGCRSFSYAGWRGASIFDSPALPHFKQPHSTTPPRSAP